MAKLANVRTGDNNTNWFDSAVSGMNAGLGVASFMNERKVQKKQMEAYDRETAEWDLNDPVRVAERNDKLFKFELDRLDVAGKTRLVQATSLGNVVQDIDTNPHSLDLQSQLDMLPGRIKEIAGDSYGFSYTPMKDTEGNNVYEVAFNGPEGFAKRMTVKNNKELAAAITQVRHGTGAYTASELQQYAILQDGAQMFLNGLTDKQKKDFGVTDVGSALANRDFMAHATNALSQKMSPAQYMEQFTQYGRNADDQDMKVAKFGMDEEQHNANMQLTKAQLANVNTSKEEAAFKFEQYKSMIPVENQKALNELNRGTVEYFNAVKDTIAGMYKPDIPLMGDDGEPNGKFAYSEKLTNKVNGIAMLASKAKEGTNPLDAMQAATVLWAERNPDEVPEPVPSEATIEDEPTKDVPPKSSSTGFGVSFNPTQAAANFHADKTIARTPEAIAAEKSEAEAIGVEARRKREEELANIYQRGTRGIGVGR